MLRGIKFIEMQTFLKKVFTFTDLIWLLSGLDIAGVKMDLCPLIYILCCTQCLYLKAARNQKNVFLPLLFIHTKETKNQKEENQTQCWDAQLSFLVVYPFHKIPIIKEERTKCNIGEENVLWLLLRGIWLYLNGCSGLIGWSGHLHWACWVTFVSYKYNFL